MLEGFRFFAPRVGELGDYNPEELQLEPSNFQANKFVYFNANTEELNQAKVVQQHEQDLQQLLEEQAELASKVHGRERLEREKLEREADRQLALMLWKKGREFGFKLLDPLSALRNHCDILLDKEIDHECSSEKCNIFHLASRTRFPDLYTRSIRPGNMPIDPDGFELEGLHFESLESSGKIYVCWNTGSVHICDRECAAISVDITDETRGYFCVISGQFKHNISDDMPSGRGVKISRHRIEAINAGHKRLLELHSFSSYATPAGDLGYDDDDDPGPDLEYANAPQHVVQEECRIDRLVGAAEEKERIVEAESDEVVSKRASLLEQALEPVEEEEEEEEDDRHPSEEEEEDDEKAKKTNPDGTPVLPGIPKGSGDIELTKIGGSELLPGDPDSRTAHFLKNPEQRQHDLMKLLGSLLEFQSHTEVWNIQLQQESKRAQDQLSSYRRKNKYRQMTVTEQYVFLAAHVATYTAPMPVPRDPLILLPYSGLILKAWDMMARSPYVRDYTKPRLIPNLTSMSLGLLYNMAQGPLIWDCSLSIEELRQIPRGLEDLPLRNLKVEVIPYGARLKIHLLPLEQLVYLNLNKKKKTQGLRCFIDCLASTVERLRQDLVTNLQSDPYEAVLSYANACDKLKCG